MESKTHLRLNPGQKAKPKVLDSILPHDQIGSLLPKLSQNFSLKLQNFQQKYSIASGRSLDENKQNAQKSAWQIKQDHPYLLQNIGNFLYENGILLFCISRETLKETGTNDGFIIYDPSKGTTHPCIVIAEDVATPRRRFFTIAHELYHILAGAGESVANQFAGALLLSEAEVLEILHLEAKHSR